MTMPAAPVAGATSRAQSWMAGHRRYVLAAGGAGVVALFLRHRTSKTSAAGGTATYAGGATVPAGGYPSDPYSAAQDAYNSLQPQLEALQSQIGAVSAAASSPSPAKPSPSAPAPSPASAAYTKISDPREGSFFAASGDNIYADVNGQFVQVAKGTQRLPNFSAIPAGSSLYVKKA